jgi:hypothetical protein
MLVFVRYRDNGTKDHFFLILIAIKKLIKIYRYGQKSGLLTYAINRHGLWRFSCPFSDQAAMIFQAPQSARHLQGLL